MVHDLSLIFVLLFYLGENHACCSYTLQIYDVDCYEKYISLKKRFLSNNSGLFLQVEYNINALIFFDGLHIHHIKYIALFSNYRTCRYFQYLMKCLRRTRSEICPLSSSTFALRSCQTTSPCITHRSIYHATKRMLFQGRNVASFPHSLRIRSQYCFSARYILKSETKTIVSCRYLFHVSVHKAPKPSRRSDLCLH